MFISLRKNSGNKNLNLITRYIIFLYNVGFWEKEENTDQSWNVSDSSLLLVRVDILDINDNPPHFLKKWFTAGVSKDTQPGTEVIDLSVSCSDFFLFGFFFTVILFLN